MPFTEQVDLAELLLDGDESAIEDILRAFGPGIRSLLRQKYSGVLIQDDIDDVLSIALYRLWIHRRRYNSEKGSLRSWFFRIADNAARDVLKHGWHKARQLEVSVGQFTAQHSEIADRANRANGDGELELVETDKQRAVRDVLRGLPETWRRIVTADALARDGTASSQFLSAELGIPASTVRVYRKRAMEKIRSELNRMGYRIP